MNESQEVIKMCAFPNLVTCPHKKNNKCSHCTDITVAANFIISKIKPRSGNLNTGVMNCDYAAFLMTEFLKEQKVDIKPNQKKEWTDADIDAAYLMGAINADMVKADEGDVFPSLSKVKKELERLKSLGFDRPYKAIKAIRKQL